MKSNPNLASFKELSELTGYSVGTLYQCAMRPDFPKPIRWDGPNQLRRKKAVVAYFAKRRLARGPYQKKRR